MFPPKKKPFPMKPKSADLSDPDPLDEKPMPKAPAKPAMPEAEEAPEATEDYGAKLIADIQAAGEEHGLDAEQSRAVAASMFDAIAKCLRGREEPTDIEANESDTENYPA